MRDEPYWKVTLNIEDHTGGSVVVSPSIGLPEKHLTEAAALIAGVDYGKRVIDSRGPTDGN
jgi:hypothetical protein